LHAEKEITWDNANARASIRGFDGKAALTTQLVARDTTWRGTVTTKFPVPVDPKYTSGDNDSPYVTGTWHDQAHLAVESAEAAKEFTVYSVFWPERGTKPAAFAATLGAGDVLTIKRPDGKTDVITLSDETFSLK